MSLSPSTDSAAQYLASLHTQVKLGQVKLGQRKVWRPSSRCVSVPEVAEVAPRSPGSDGPLEMTIPEAAKPQAAKESKDWRSIRIPSRGRPRGEARLGVKQQPHNRKNPPPVTVTNPVVPSPVPAVVPPVVPSVTTVDQPQQIR